MGGVGRTAIGVLCTIGLAACSLVVPTDGLSGHVAPIVSADAAADGATADGGTADGGTADGAMADAGDAAPGSSPPPDALVLWLRFDESAGASTFVDSSGAGNQATCSTGSCPTLGVPGAVRTASAMNGSTQYVTVPRSQSLSVGATVAAGAFVSMTVPPSTTGELTGYEVISMADGYVLEITPDGGVRFFIFDGTTYQIVDSAGVYVVDGAFHHVLGQKTSSALEVYVDGTLRGTAAFSGNIAYPVDSALEIGRHANRLLRFFNGVVDEVTIHSRVLSGAEIAALAVRRGG